MGGKRVLIVEDERIVAEDLRETLEHLGYEVPAIASTGADAIEQARIHRPDLVLMDIVLKGPMNGVTAAGDVRETLDIPVVYLTAYADEETLARAKLTEPYGYLIKPFEERELASAIEMALYRHAMERKLRLSERWLYTTLNSIGDAVIATDEQGCVRFSNPVAAQLTGWTHEEALDHPLSEVFDILNEETRARVENPVAKVLREGVVVGLANHTALVARDGRETPIADSAAPILADDGKIQGVVLVFRDVSTRRRREKELRRIQKLESVGLLAGGIAHDFNNILTSLVGNIGCAKLPDLDLVERDELLTEAEAAVWRARDLTQQLLTFSSGGSPVKSVEPLPQLVAESAAFALRGSNVKCGIGPSDDVWPVAVDTGQMNQVFNNLFINADQAMPEGGSVTVAIENLEIVRGDASALAPGSYVSVSIGDEGIGIAPDHLHKVFDPYFSTKQKGSGLGLAVCHSIIHGHGGKLLVESQLGVGTTFRVLLPASAAPTRRAPEEPPAPITGKGRVLFMDDDVAIVALVTRVLDRAGFEVASALDGVTAVGMYAAAQSAGEPFDAVLLDLTVPGGMGGSETLEQIQEIDPDVKAIVCSGYSHDPVLADHRGYGFRAAVVKPFRPDDLARVIRDVIDGSP